MFGGGSSAQQQQPEQTYQQSSDAYAQPMDNGLYNGQNQAAAAQDQPCALDVKNFTSCMNENQGNMTICGWYMDQLKACQQAARPY
jgi:coiled-coil-helix-coiled-coil-helix domain-containing protein 2